MLLRVRMFLGKVRRQFLIFFMQGYIRRQIARRRGECRQCGVCCRFSYPCPLLRRNGDCAVYDTTRPRVCSFFPINRADIEDVRACGGECGYWFE